MVQTLQKAMQTANVSTLLHWHVLGLTAGQDTVPIVNFCRSVPEYATLACSCRTCCSMARLAPAKPQQPWLWLGSSLGEFQKKLCLLASTHGKVAGFVHQLVSAMFTGHASATSSV